VSLVLWAYGHESPFGKSTPNAGLPPLPLLLLLLLLLLFLLQPRVARQH
jgi:hypothetical protein